MLEAVSFMEAAASRASAHWLIFSATVRGKVVFVAGAPVAVVGIASSSAALAAATVVTAAAGLVVTAARAAAAAVWNRPRRAITGGCVRGFGVRRAVVVQAQPQSRHRFAWKRVMTGDKACRTTSVCIYGMTSCTARATKVLVTSTAQKTDLLCVLAACKTLAT